MRKQSNKEKLAAIATVLKKRQSPDAASVEEAVEMRELSRDQRLRIADELTFEFAECGLQPDSEPSSYGLELEDLIDFCGVSRF